MRIVRAGALSEVFTATRGHAPRGVPQRVRATSSPDGSARCVGVVLERRPSRGGQQAHLAAELLGFRTRGLARGDERVEASTAFGELVRHEYLVLARPSDARGREVRIVLAQRRVALLERAHDVERGASVRSRAGRRVEVIVHERADRWSRRCAGRPIRRLPATRRLGDGGRRRTPHEGRHGGCGGEQAGTEHDLATTHEPSGVPRSRPDVKAPPHAAPPPGGRSAGFACGSDVACARVGAPCRLLPVLVPRSRSARVRPRVDSAPRWRRRRS